MDKNNNHHSGGGFMNGFFLGVIVGAAIVFLLATKKGKQILKTLTENGFEGMSELTDMLEEDEEAVEEGYTQNGEAPVAESQVATRKPIKRFFHGIRK